MDSSDKNVKDALESIFGEDFIEIDVDSLNKESSSRVNERFLFTDKDDMINNEVNYPDIIKSDEEKEIIISNKTNKDDGIINKPKRKYKLIIILISIIVLIIFIFILINRSRNKIITKTCNFNIDTKEYKVSEEYKITYKNNKLLYVDGIYKYSALTDEFKQQIDYVKKDKLNVLINSNGMPGFTYIYELDTDSFKISSYLDFNLIEFDKVDKINQKIMPLSYFNINSKLTAKKLIKLLEKKEFTCNIDK